MTAPMHPNLGETDDERLLISNLGTFLITLSGECANMLEHYWNGDYERVLMHFASMIPNVGQCSTEVAIELVSDTELQHLHSSAVDTLEIAKSRRMQDGHDDGVVDMAELMVGVIETWQEGKAQIQQVRESTREDGE